MRVSEALARGAREIGIALGREVLEAFERYHQELDDWAKRVNLTAVEGEEEVAVKHFLDSLTCLKGADFREGTTVVDVGSGAGFPGVPLKIVRPGIRLTLVEATRKRVEFLRHIVTVLGLGDVEVVWDRSENVSHAPGRREAYRVAVARAVADLAVLAELCLPLVEVGGTMLAQKGPEVAPEVARASAAVATMGGWVERIIPLSLPWGHGDRTLVVVRKHSHTPAKYPRRPGVPEKRPIE
ncbi:MAG: 16S rRNA (guanine(527)-N(7))-methyltransferase RsmG [Bacillota bacterium]|jgi:16S rRNA (guanine527-N7)-methyltransferase